MKAAPEEWFNASGKRLVRRDLISDAQYQEILAASNYDGPPTLDSLAHAMRSHTLVHGIYYVQTEPDYDLAAEILRTADQPRGTTGSRPREARSGIIGSDDRSHSTTTWDDWPYRTFGFSQVGCTSTMIGRSTAITAAHCLFDTLGIPNGWICRDGSKDNDANPCDDSPGGDGVPGDPHWAFGVEDNNRYLTWRTCQVVNISSGFAGLTTASSGDTLARWDYGVIDFSSSGAGACGSPTPGNSTGWLGTWIASNGNISGNVMFNFGYPAYATCGNGDAGTFADCGVGSFPGTNYRYINTAPAFGGAEIWGMSYGVGSASAGASGVIQATADVTKGMSGSSLYFALNGAQDYRVIGVLSNGDAQPFNRFNRFTNEVFNFLVANSQYPDDTL